MENSIKHRISKAAEADAVLSNEVEKRWHEKNKTGHNIGVKCKGLERLRYRNTEMLKRIIKIHGFLTIKIIGEKGMHDAWYIVQHSDHDLKFQQNYLNNLKKLDSKRLSIKRDIAYLTDRVAEHNNKRQVYGTQVKYNAKGKPELCPCIDIKNLDKRRKAVGLEPYKKYLRSFE